MAEKKIITIGRQFGSGKSRASPENAGRKRLSYDRAAEKT